jgi:hypothetical protein
VHHVFVFSLVTLFCSSSVLAAPITIDFEGLADSTILSTQYAGLTFSNAIILTSGIGLNEFELPPFSGSNVASDNNGPISISFDDPVLSFGGYFTYYEPITLVAFDISNNQIKSATSQFNKNVACGDGPPCLGDPGSSPNEFLFVAFASDPRPPNWYPFSPPPTLLPTSARHRYLLRLVEEVVRLNYGVTS